MTERPICRRPAGEHDDSCNCGRDGYIRPWDKADPAAPLLDADGWPTLEGAQRADLQLAIKAAGPLAAYGNFLRAALAGIYAERQRAKAVRDASDGPDDQIDRTVPR